MKKIISTLILSFMILTMLVGCANVPNNDTDNQSNSGNTEQNGSENQDNNNIQPMPPEYVGGDENENLPPFDFETPDNNENLPGGDSDIDGEMGQGGGSSGNGAVGGGETVEGGEVGEGEEPGGENTGGGNQGDNNTNPDDPDGNLPDEGGNTEEGVITPTPTVGTNVGDLFADVTLETLSGESINTADFRGKILIVNVWATWCPPCKAELPDFNIIAREFADDVVIVAAHTPNGNGNALSYVNTNFPETNIIFAYDTVYSDAYIAAGGSQYVPQTAIIDRNGVIIYSDSGMMSYKQILEIIESYL